MNHVSHPISFSVLHIFSAAFLFYLSTLPGPDPEETLDLDGAPALRLDSNMGVVMGLRRSMWRWCMCAS